MGSTAADPRDALRLHRQSGNVRAHHRDPVSLGVHEDERTMARGVLLHLLACDLLRDELLPHPVDVIRCEVELDRRRVAPRDEEIDVADAEDLDDRDVEDLPQPNDIAVERGQRFRVARTDAHVTDRDDRCHGGDVKDAGTLAVLALAAAGRSHVLASELVADVLAQGFARKDAALLATVISTACVTEGVAQGGASTKSSARYLDELKQRFARGLMVEVRRGTLGAAEGIDNPNRVLQSTWREPGQPDLEVDLLIAPERADRWSWRGVITVGR